MKVLENLRERDEIIDYIDIRVRAHNELDLSQYPESQRAGVRLMTIGRIRELEKLKEVISTTNGLRSAIRNYAKYFNNVENGIAETETMILE